MTGDAARTGTPGTVRTGDPPDGRRRAQALVHHRVEQAGRKRAGHGLALKCFGQLARHRVVQRHDRRMHIIDQGLLVAEARKRAGSHDAADKVRSVDRQAHRVSRAHRMTDDDDRSQ